MPHIAPRPVGQRVEFDATFGCQIGLIEQRHLGARARLFTAQTRHPRFFARQRTLQRRHFADVAAGFAQRNALVHRLIAFAGDELDDRFVIRGVNAELVAQRQLLLGQQRQSLCVQFAGFQNEHGNVECQSLNQMGDHHVFRTQTAGLGDVSRVSLRGLAQQGAGCLQFGVKSRRGTGMKVDSGHGHFQVKQ